MKSSCKKNVLAGRRVKCTQPCASPIAIIVSRSVDSCYFIIYLKVLPVISILCPCKDLLLFLNLIFFI